jgi:DNA-binding response OmpR family regulator
MAQRILLIEDNVDYAEILGLHLRDEGWEIEVAHDGEEGLRLAEAGGFDLVILDLLLPGMEGLEVCQRLRARPSYLPIIMLTAKSTELDRVAGLETGADDYVVKPCSINELLARVKALFRRVEMLGGGEAAAGGAAAGSAGPIAVGELTIDPGRRSATMAGRPLDLTAKEFDLLAHFARHPGRVFTRAELLHQVWGYGHQGYEHTVNTHINRLRAKVEADPSEPRYILTVWGVGYKFTECAEGGDGDGDGDGDGGEAAA